MQEQQILVYFFLLFALTVLVEGLLAWALFRRLRIVYDTFLCNLLTNSAMNILLTLFVSLRGAGGYALLVAALETAVVVTEALILRALNGWTYPKAFACSLLLNAASYGAGLLAHRWI